MRNICLGLLILNLLVSCQNTGENEKKSDLPDSIAQASPEQVKKIMDSILKANPGARLPMEDSGATK